MANQCTASALCERVKSTVQRHAGAVELLLREAVVSATVLVHFIALMLI